MTKKIFVVVGPTASGKSDFAVDLAHTYDGEIISADSRQVYKGLDLGTGKITEGEMKGIKHHMLDVISPTETFSVAEYKKRALPLLEDILARGKTPIICGGTGQYIDSLIFTQEIPAVPPNDRLREELSYLSTNELVKKLGQLDKRRLGTIDTHNRVRLIRAIEVASHFGKVPPLKEPSLRYETRVYLLNPDRSTLHARIAKRLLARLDMGMLDECRRLLKEGVSHEKLERLGLEYRYMSRLLKGEITYEEFVVTLTHKINQYAKRQITWNKKYLPFAEIVPIAK